jgi:phospholipid transport system substrate-binding protein
MTSSALGRFWRKASPVQRVRLQEEFTQLVLRSYAGALTQVNDQTIRVRPLRAAPDDRQVVVRTEVRGGRTPVRLDYRLTKTPDGWKIFDVNVLGVWLTLNYRNSFATEIGRSGIDGLIDKLAQKNQANHAR